MEFPHLMLVYPKAHDMICYIYMCVCVCIYILYIYIYMFIICIYGWQRCMKGAKQCFRYIMGFEHTSKYIYIYECTYMHTYTDTTCILYLYYYTHIYIYTHQIWYIMNVLIPIRCKGQTSSTIDTSWCAKSQGQTPKFNHRKLNGCTWSAQLAWSMYPLVI